MNDTRKVPYYRKKAPAYRGKSGQNTGTDFLALGLRVVLSLPNFLSMNPGESCPQMLGNEALVPFTEAEMLGN